MDTPPKRRACDDRLRQRRDHQPQNAGPTCTPITALTSRMATVDPCNRLCSRSTTVRPSGRQVVHGDITCALHPPPRPAGQSSSPAGAPGMCADRSQADRPVDNVSRGLTERRSRASPSGAIRPRAEEIQVSRRSRCAGCAPLRRQRGTSAAPGPDRAAAAADSTAKPAAWPGCGSPHGTARRVRPAARTAPRCWRSPREVDRHDRRRTRGGSRRTGRERLGLGRRSSPPSAGAAAPPPPLAVRTGSRKALDVDDHLQRDDVTRRCAPPPA